MDDLWSLSVSSKPGAMAAFIDIKKAAMIALNIADLNSLPTIGSLKREHKVEIDSELIKMRLKDG